MEWLDKILRICPVFNPQECKMYYLLLGVFEGDIFNSI